MPYMLLHACASAMSAFPPTFSQNVIFLLCFLALSHALRLLIIYPNRYICIFIIHYVYVYVPPFSLTIYCPVLLCVVITFSLHAAKSNFSLSLGGEWSST